ncbi:molybdopterin molybdenumtransferase MoeA [Limnohabitans curvus]|jgi:molybdopterin molybdotransferase|uniref:Molybdopterin molybdenumtransferase n=1 Tax=Limnohabitans curvus TaxID=323423 RepID=A0A315ESM2_9BURK|nr:gephyrin-like molybdotransferase Glp [Limnohabitans curvus]PUE60251.1 molybdopterin molybdenumtransferase MoeA [Limnohabitans curvus]
MTRPALLSLDDALPQLLAQARALTGVQLVSTFDADGRVLARDVVAALQVPPQDNSSMDGYALRAADCAQAGAVLRVTQRIPAGTHGTQLNAGEAARIFTGAPIPPGADAVVMQEDCDALESEQVQVTKAVPAGQWIRRSGEDVTRGATVLSQGTRLTPAELGLAASIGLAQLQVSARPRVALFSTGDELVMPGDVAPEAMPAGAIYNSNRFFLRAMLQRLGCEVTDLGIVPDKRDATIAALRDAALHHDLILTSGGVSVGEEDHIKPAVESLGELNLWQLAIKPGKPFAYGKVNREAQADACHFMGLPGNPVSSFVTFLLLVRPFVLALQGVTKTDITRTDMTAHFDWPRADKRREFLRVKRNAQGGLDLFPNQSSGVLTSAVWGDGVVDNPAGQTISKGDTVRFISFAEWLA